MQNIIIAKPYEFVPPAHGTLLADGVSPVAPALPGQGLGSDPRSTSWASSPSGRRSASARAWCSCRTTAGRATRWS